MFLLDGRLQISFYYYLYQRYYLISFSSVILRNFKLWQVSVMIRTLVEVNGKTQIGLRLTSEKKSHFPFDMRFSTMLTKIRRCNLLEKYVRNKIRVIFLFQEIPVILREARTSLRLPCRELNSTEPPHDKTNKVTVYQAKTQISLGIRPV